MEELSVYISYNNNSSRNNPKEILNRFRILYPELNKTENENSFGIKHKLAIILIEQLRHIIVHERGVVSECDDFINELMKSHGQCNGSNNEPACREFIKKYLVEGENEAVITLLEIPITPDNSGEGMEDLFANLVGYLISYASLLCSVIEQHER